MTARPCGSQVRCGRVCRLLLLCAMCLVAAAHSLCAQPAAISLAAPLDYQVFQRQTRTSGTVEIRGTAHVHADRAEARVTGASPGVSLDTHWVRLKIDKSSGEFAASLTEPAGGFYQVEVHLLRHGRQVADITVPHVGVGEVFVIAGQSNSTNYGEVQQTTDTGMVVAFDGTRWQVANDPQPGVQDHSKKGSFIPAFGDALYRRYRVPIGIAAVGHGSTSVRQWLPAGEPVRVMPTMTKFITRSADGEPVCDGILFNGMMQRIHQLGPDGFRAMLWHQGESDANQSPARQITPDAYRRMMVDLITASRKSAGWNFPWIVAEATYHTPQDPGSPEFEAAQRSLWQDGLALEGPNTDTLGPEYRQNGGKGVHFSESGLKAHGALWAKAVERMIDAAATPK
jgi:hypothetical protein